MIKNGTKVCENWGGIKGKHIFILKRFELSYFAAEYSWAN